LKPAEIKRLFKPFTQAHDGIAGRFGGTGLGLSLVKRMARAMKGDLGVTSTPGRGSTFILKVVVGRAI
jgi:signal transduction histidine kinase